MCPAATERTIFQIIRLATGLDNHVAVPERTELTEGVRTEYTCL
jgi:hypothetical protein